MMMMSTTRLTAVLARRTGLAALRQHVPAAWLMLQRRSLTTAPGVPKATPPNVIRMPAHDPPKAFAVEAPDGTADIQEEANLDVVERMQNFSTINEQQQQHPMAADVFAVDAPDGESDDIHEADVHEVQDIIDFAAEHENKEEVIRRHDLEEKTRQAIRKGGFPGYW